MIMMVSFLIAISISFALAWNVQQAEINHLKEELQLEKAKSQFYKNRRV